MQAESAKTTESGGTLFRVRRAPNGKESRLDERQYDEVRTGNFKRWFGDWENDPENASKVVDENGEPLVVYHGTDNDFFTFDRGRLGENTDFNADEIVGQTAHIVFWFNRGGEEMLDMTYGKRMPVYLDIKEPVEFTSLRALSDEIAMRGGAERFVDDMRDAGHDGVVVKDEEFGGTSYVAFDPTQIKSATENNGDFSRENGDIRFRFVGERGAGRQDMADGGERMRNKEIAEAMERVGKGARAIKLATGWERGKDGKWRHEEGDGQLRVGVSDLLNGGVRRLDQVRDDPELFEAYPELREARVLVHDIGDAIASWSNSNRPLSLSNEQLRHMNEAMLRETIAHEMQHAIQSIESFAQGGSPDMMRQELLTSEQHELIEEERERLIERKSQLEREYIPIYKRNTALPGTVSSAERERLGELVRELEQIDNQIDELNKMLYSSIGYDAYHRLAGEVEARNVSERMEMTDEQRRGSLAADTEDVARDEQIVRFGNGVSMMGSRVDKRMAEIGQLLEGRDMTDEQRKVADVFSGKSDNQTIEVERNDGKRRIVMRQGNEQGAGAKHSVFGHYGTTRGVITAEDVLRIPDIIPRWYYHREKTWKCPP